jgi:nucleotide-binding universal stress UspA family protein
MSVFPTKILLATDGSEDARRATEAAADLAGKSGSELHVVHVWHDVPGFAHAFVKRELRRQGQEILDGQVQKIEASGGTVTRAHLRGGRTSDEVIELSEELGVGLLVVGSRGLGTVRRILIGSHSEEIVHHALVPVLVVRRGSQVLLVYAHPDLPEVPPGEAREAMAQELRGAREQDEERLEGRADELGEILGSRPEILVSDGYPAAVVLQAAHQETPPPLIAVGSRGIAGIRRTRLGSVSTKVVTAARGPVLVYPHVD